MSAENPFDNNSYGFPPAEQQAAPKQGRFNQMLHDPNLQARARTVARGVGEEALRGAVEGSGLVKVREDGTMKVRKIGVAKAIVRPTHTARKAAMGAAQGARAAATEEIRAQAGAIRSEAIQATTTGIMNAMNQAPAVATANPNGYGGFPPAGENNWASFPAPNAQENPFAVPVLQQSAVYEQARKEKSGRKFFGHKQTAEQPLAANANQYSGGFPAVPDQYQGGFPPASSPVAFGGGFPAANPNSFNTQPDYSYLGQPGAAPMPGNYGGGFPPAPTQASGGFPPTPH